MKSLHDHLQRISTLLHSNEDQDRALRSELDKILKTVFPKLPDPAKMIRDRRLKGGVLVITAINKSFANELFLHAEEIRTYLIEQKKITIRELVIR